MDSYALISSNNNNNGKEEVNPFQIVNRSLGYSSFSPPSCFSSSSSSSNPDSPSISRSPVRSSSGIPFSWEYQPGIPKQSRSPSSKNKLVSTLDLLPLPPGKEKSQKISVGDPFATALIECSKDSREVKDQCWKRAKGSKTLTERYGFVKLCGSCKKTCCVSDSIVSIPKSNRTGFSQLNRRSG